jgi:DNA-binding MarR family transcriptional regulator
MAFLMAGSNFHRAYLGKRLQDLLDLTHVQMQKVYEKNGLSIRVQGSSTLQALGPDERLSLADLARKLGQPHQLIAQRIERLLKAGLVSKAPDPADRRRSEYRLTDEGKRQWMILDRLMHEAGTVNEELFREIGTDLVDALERARDRLETRGLHDRFDDLHPTKDNA